jgi:aminopeptidase N
MNGNPAPVEKNSTYLLLPAAFLIRGPNLIKISFRTKMVTNGMGLHRFVDPADGAIYIHTQFEAFAAHKFMPCFDQPDLKSSLQLQVSAPKSWTLISTTREIRIEPRGDFRLWTFPETPAISTYLFSLHGGPFTVWQDSFQGIPLRLFARPSLAKYVHPGLWFRLTKQGLGFYNKFFSYRYPFQKYDQILAPEFSAGAMENVGAVTFSERFIHRGKLTRENEMSLADVLLHEMAHMWFGDLVTMRWWNDLWLNESFATYMSALTTSEATKYSEAWRDFFEMKGWAYYQDQLSTTHPIEGHVADTNDAFSSFDGITYAKGASVLKQMSRWLGAETFQKGVQFYMKTFAFKNTSLPDFIESLQKFSERDFRTWS